MTDQDGQRETAGLAAAAEPDVARLLADRARLEAQIAEIDTALARAYRAGVPLRWYDNPSGKDPRSPGSVMRADLGGPGHYALIEPEGDGFTWCVMRPRAFPDIESSGEASDTGGAKVQVAAYLARLERDWP